MWFSCFGFFRWPCVVCRFRAAGGIVGRRSGGDVMSFGVMGVLWVIFIKFVNFMVINRIKTD